MKIPEIERDLRNHADPRIIYHMQRMQEEINSLRDSLNAAAKLMEQMSDILTELHRVNIQLNDKWLKRLQGGNDIEMVKSVLPTPPGSKS